MKTLESIAKVCHEANRAYCEGLGDDSQKPWELAPEWQRESARKGVRFQLANPEAPASATHEAWLAEKRAAGWKYGPVKDAEKKEHPCFLPFEELSEAQQRKDHLFKAIVGALGCRNWPEGATGHVCEECDPEAVAKLNQENGSES